MAWGTAYVLQAYLTMFMATGDTGYIDKFVEVAYTVLEMRDTVRQTPDFLGRVRPVWSAGNAYTACWHDVLDITGRPILRLRSLANGSPPLASVRPSQIAGAFDVYIEFNTGGVKEIFRDLSFDRAAARYAVSVLKALTPTPTALTAVDLRAETDNAVAVAEASQGTMIRYRYAFGVHTGMITAPLAGCAATIRASQDLRRQFTGPAEDFLEAARTAVDAHDNEWASYGSRAGLYVYPRGVPVRGDGTPLPHNQYLALARTHLYLYRATQDQFHKARAELMLSVFMSDLGPGPAPVWPYHWSKSAAFRGFGPSEISTYSPSMAPNRDLEDTAHGALDIECLVLARSSGIGPSNTEMRNIAATFLRRIAVQLPSGQLTSKNSLNPEAGHSENDLSVPRWAVLAPWNRDVVTFSKGLLNQLAPTRVSPQTLASIAALVAQRP